MCKVVMAVAKETKGTFQFKEVVADKEPAIIGTLYVPKRTLEIMGFDPAKKQVITVDLGIQESSNEKTDGKADPAPAQEIKESPAPAPAKKRGRKAKAESPAAAPEAKSSPAPAVKRRGRKAKTA